MSLLEISDLTKSYGVGDEQHVVLERVNLKVDEGEVVAIVGYSGSGKTTLVSLLAGLHSADAGGVIYAGEQVTEPHPDIAVVFQSYSLMPWLSVSGNVRLAVDSVHSGKKSTERAALVEHYVDMVGLSHATDRKPAELSGGMRQRVALARALAMRPKVLLLDEPLSALDALTRAKLQDELADISAQANCTIVLITNDVDEAILMADRIVPLTKAPAATLEREFMVDLPKPRDRTLLNSDPAFAELRADVTRYLVSLDESGGESAQTEGGASSSICKEQPNVVPVRFDSKPHASHVTSVAAAITDAAASHISKSYLSFSQVSKVYPTPEGPLTVVEDFELKIDKGEFVTLIGHSGCGKSTVLSMAAGLNPITRGGIVLDGLHVTDAGPDRAVVFQAPSLMPWLTARENVMLGVDRVYPNNSRSERRDVAEYYLEKVGLADAMSRPVDGFSSGMQQRVGIARAFALSPKLLLLDEPFGMLDSLTRWTLQDVLMEVWSQTQVTAICVTHDVDEAILLADRVVMMSNGPEARVGNVMEVDLPRPRTREVLLSHPHYYAYREELLAFLEAYEGGASPSEEHLQSIEAKRRLRMGAGDANVPDVPARDSTFDASACNDPHTANSAALSERKTLDTESAA